MMKLVEKHENNEEIESQWMSLHLQSLFRMNNNKTKTKINP